MAHFENYNYLTTSDACVKCGKCLPDCTIFAINGDEATSPRGFIDLLGAYQRKEIPLDKNAKEIFEKIKDKKVSAFVSGVGTSGTLSGVGEFLKKKLA